MEEKELTNEEIIKALDKTKQALANISPEDDDYDELLTLKTIVDYCHNLIHRQKAEIEWLVELQSRGAYRVAELGIENAELQKQVDELKKERNDLLHERQMAFMDGQQQAVKDTAPVAINRFINQLHIDGVLRDEGDLSNELRKVKVFVLKRYYGVEVE